jgi:hypothetical protein
MSFDPKWEMPITSTEAEEFAIVEPVMSSTMIKDEKISLWKLAEKISVLIPDFPNEYCGDDKCQHLAFLILRIVRMNEHKYSHMPACEGGMCVKICDSIAAIVEQKEVCCKVCSHTVFETDVTCWFCQVVSPGK